MRNAMYTSGDPEIDRFRQRIADNDATTYDNFPYRLSLITTWINLLQRQGADLTGYAAIFDMLKQSRDKEDYKTLFSTLREAVEFLNDAQQQISSFPAEVISNTIEPKDDVQQQPLNWALYGRDTHHTASTHQAGPRRGELAWRKPVGLAWYARPEVDAGRVYISSPGIRNQATCYDIKTGQLIWQTRRNWTWDSLGIVNLSPSSYVLTGAASSPLILQDTIIINELGAQGRNLGGKNLLEIDKRTGKLRRCIRSGEADYRIGYPPVTGNETIVVYPTGTQRAQETPPQLVGQNRLVCQSLTSQEILWDFHIGATFCEPILDGDHVYVGNADGIFYCLRAIGISGRQHFGFSDTERVVWQFRADGATNASATTDDACVYVGSNDGMIHCLDKVTGDPVWRTQVPSVEARSFRLFSKPYIANGRIYIGSATRHLYVLDKHNGAMLWSFEADDWIRARPCVFEEHVLCATLSGSVYCLDQQGRFVWHLATGQHAILADLTQDSGYLLVNTSDLQTLCVDIRSGEINWHHPILDQAIIGEQYYPADELACGGWYQSKPTVADAKVFIGTPSRFVIAYNHETGQEIWKFEVGGAVSAAPAYHRGKLYFGQKGEEYFYCIDAETGHLIWKQAVGWVWSSANVAYGKVYVPGSDGYVSCLDANTGHIVWRFRTGKSTAPEPPIDDGLVFFGSWDHFIYALDAETGQLRWQFHTGGSPDSGAPIAYKGKLYVPMGGNRIVCLDSKTGELLWEYQLSDGDLNASPSLYGDNIYISLGLRPGAIPIASRIQCLDAKTGSLIWEHPGGGITGSSVADGYVYFASTTDPFFYCVDARGNDDGTTNILWRYNMGERVYESVPAIYDRHAYILSESGYLFAFI